MVLCSHLLSEIEHVCDDVIILNDGRIVAQGTVAEVIGGDQTAARQGTALGARAAGGRYAGGGGGGGGPARTGEDPAERRADGGRLRIELADSVADEESRARLINNDILGAIIRIDVPVVRFEVEGGRLQDVFLPSAHSRTVPPACSRTRSASRSPSWRSPC